MISVIVPVYNVEQYIVRCINSILKQTYKNFELVLIDDGSKDNSGKICDAYVAKDERIRVIHQKNGGLSAARNTGLSVMRGKYVTFIDSDDFVHEKYLEALYRLIMTSELNVSQVSFEHGTAESFSEKSKKAEVTIFHNSRLFGDRRVKITAWAKLYKASLLTDIRFPVGKINEDEFFTYKAIAYAEGIAVSTEKLYYYYSRPGSIMHTKKYAVRMDFREAYQQRIAFFEERNDSVAVDLSYKEYAIRLMLAIASHMTYSDNPNDVEQLLKDFQSAYKSISNKKLINTKERIMLRAFSINPSVAAKVIQMIRCLR